MRRIPRTLPLVASLLLILGACRPAGEERAYVPTYGDAPVEHDADVRGVMRVGVRLVRRPERIIEVYQPLIDYLNREMGGAALVLDLSSGDRVLEEKLRRGGLHFAIADPYSVAFATEYGYRVLARVGREDTTRSVLVVRRDSGLRALDALKGRRIAFPDMIVLAGNAQMSWSLHRQGLLEGRDFIRLAVGSNEASILSVSARQTDAGSTSLNTWRAFGEAQPETARLLDVLWQSDALPGNGVVAHRSVPAERANRVRALLLGLAQRAEGPALLGALHVDGFYRADRSTYAPALAMVRQTEEALGWSGAAP